MKPKQVNLSKRAFIQSETKSSNCTKVIRRRSRSHCLSYDGCMLDAFDLSCCSGARIQNIKRSKRTMGKCNSILDTCLIQCATGISDTDDNTIDDTYCKLFNVNQVDWIPSNILIENNDKNKENHNSVRKNRRRKRKTINQYNYEFVPLSIRSYSQPYLYMMDDVVIYDTVQSIQLPEKRYRSRSQDDSGTNLRLKMNQTQIDTKYQDQQQQQQHQQHQTQQQSYQMYQNDENLTAMEPNINATINVSQINFSPNPDITTGHHLHHHQQQQHQHQHQQLQQQQHQQQTNGSPQLDMNTVDNSYEDEDNIFGNLCHANCTHREHTDSEEDLYHCKEIHNTEVAQRAYRNYIEQYCKLNSNINRNDAAIEAAIRWNKLTRKERLPYFLQAYISQYMPTYQTTTSVQEEVWEQTSYLCIDTVNNGNYCNSQNSNQEE